MAFYSFREEDHPSAFCVYRDGPGTVPLNIVPVSFITRSRRGEVWFGFNSVIQQYTSTLGTRQGGGALVPQRDAREEWGRTDVCPGKVSEEFAGSGWAVLAVP